MIGLHAARGEEDVGALGPGAGGDQRELAHLVAAEAERNGVVSLHQEPRAAAQSLAQTRHLLHGRGLAQQRLDGQAAQAGQGGLELARGGPTGGGPRAHQPFCARRVVMWAV